MTETSPPLYRARYGRYLIAFQIVYRARKTLAIHVYPSGQVEVVAPLGVTLRDIKTKIVKRGGWILKQQRYFARLPAPLPERGYRSGEGYRYLGRQYRLKVEAAATPSVKLLNGRLTIALPDPQDAEVVQALVTRWYRQRAEVIFTNRLSDCMPLVSRYGVPEPLGWRLVRMTKRWGSCSRAGRILLNPELVTAPKDCIDYVIVHELCHLKEYNHSPAYYRLLDQVLPGWPERKRHLDQTVDVQGVSRLCSD